MGDKMKHTNKYKKALITLLMSPAILLMACTEERPYDTLSRTNADPEISKATSGLCNEKDVYLYVPSTVETSRKAAATRPHWMGSEKLVKLKCQKDQLAVVEVDSEGKFNDNTTNMLPVLTIPMKHVDYKCATDADGKCTQKEELDDDKHWTEKRFAQINFSKMEVQETNFLPIQLANLGFSCFTPTSAILDKASIEKDAINITIEQNMKANVLCTGLRTLDDLKALGFKVKYHYSLVKLDSIASPDYKPIQYSKAEETTFGFFNTESDKLDVDNRETVFGENTFLNRFHPNKTIKYQLSEDFLKPENQALIAHTKAAIESINKTFKAAGAKTQIEVTDPVEELSTGDIRVNSIVLEDDPLAMNVIGYGPSAANPLTGEILHARTVMYLGTIRKFVYRTYDEFVTKMKMEEQLKNTVPVDGQKIGLSQSIKMVAESAMQAQRAMGTDNLVKATHHGHDHAHFHAQDEGFDDIPGSGFINERLLKDAVTNPLNQQLSSNDLRLANLEENKESIRNISDEFLMSKNCFYSTDMLAPITAGVEAQIEALVKELGMRTYAELTETEKQKVVDTVLPFYWVPVLVHEIGHNLGLRHNFAGSEDKANFYTKAELKQMGIDRDISYSSVMDYTYSTLNELPVMGKYDIAALRFGYAEAVEDKDGNIVSLEKFRKGGVELKDYKFCTDEHVAVNPNCNRFDEGTNLTEIIQHHIKAYEEGYARNNFRNGLRDFSLMDDVSYAARLGRTLGAMRLVFERYETIKKDFGIDDNHQAWETSEFLKDLKTATVLAGKYLVKVLKTPDLMCAISAKANPGQIVALMPIKQLSPVAVDCFDSENLQINPNYVIVGRAGKLFQSGKDRRNSNAYVDQIDVRGVWIDKLVALDTLIGRKTGISTFDKYRDNFMDVPEVAAELDSALRGILLDQTVAPVEIEVITGQKLTVNFPVKMFNKAEGQNGHRIIDPLSGYAKRVFGREFQLKDGNPSFQEVVLANVNSKMPSQKQIADANSILNATRVGVARITDNVPGIEQGVVSTRIGQYVFYASVLNNVAANQIQLYSIASLLESLGEDKVKEIAEKKEKKEKLADDATPAEKAAYDMPANILKAFIDGQIQAKEFYEMSILAAVN